MTTETPDPGNKVDFILDLFARQGAREYMGEAVAISQHMEQSAACGAVRLRHYDDVGKVADLSIKPVTAYRETLTSLMLR